MRGESTEPEEPYVDPTLPKPFTEHGHKAEVDTERGRVVCTECPWFMWAPDAGLDSLRDAARRHRRATTLR